MSWQKEWQAILCSIDDFSIICGDHVAALSAGRDDSYGTMRKIIAPMARDIASRISGLEIRYGSQLSRDAIQRLSAFVTTDLPMVTGFDAATSSAKSASAAAHFSCLFRRFKSDFNYFTSDLEGIALRLSARAFSHLQRSIVADERVRDTWIAAYKEGEVACEKLGSLHLLQHGIWSFKINSIGERTDLVLGEPLSDVQVREAESVAEGLVLTEWKIAASNKSDDKYKEAMSQAKLYSQGSLASLELRRYRYLVVVTEAQVVVPPDLEEGSHVYKHINVAVNPNSPSKAAKILSA